MRGFTMLLVVYSHIQVRCFGLNNLVFESAIPSFNFNSIFVEFRMPLFFFISGWVLYKKSRIWDGKTCLTFLGKKFKVQILSTLVFFTLFVYLFNRDILHSLGSFKAGYWFTYTLFFYFLFYVFSVYIARAFHMEKKEDVVVILVAIGALLAYSIAAVVREPLLMKALMAVGVFQWKYYVFFCFGTLVKKYFNTFVSLTEKSWVMGLTVVCFLLSNIIQPLIQLPHSDLVFFLINGFLGVTIIFTVFRKSEKWFEADHRISHWMQYIGRHTLDIYLLHYFFLPYNLRFVGDYFNAHPDHTVELFVSIALSLMVITVCLLVSKVIYTSPRLGEFLFGKKG